MPDGRAEILADLRAALAGIPAERAPWLDRPLPGAAHGLETHELRVERFVEALERVGGQVRRVRGEPQARSALAALLEELGATEVALSDDALVRRLASDLPAGVSAFDGWSDRQRLFACDAGLSAAQWGIAESGTLVLESAAERHRLVSLVPPVHVAVLLGSTILPGLGDALEALDGAAASRAVTLITGPSRTADIELELVVGVHGPRALHVVVLEEPSA